MSAFVIVDPNATKTRRDWRWLEPKLAALYPYMSVAFLRHREEASSLVAAALREGHSEIVAVGSGGTLNGAVNGFFDSEGAVSPDAVLACVGNGQDSLARLKTASVRPIDVGRVQYLSRDGLPRTRYFATMASFGLSGQIVAALNHSFITPFLGRRTSFALHHMFAAMRYRGRAVRLIVDRKVDEIATISTVAVANGHLFGTPMEIAPDAKPDDGEFDIVIMTQFDGARIVRGRKVVAAPVEETHGKPVLVELDGAGIGRLPATFEIRPRALNVRC